MGAHLPISSSVRIMIDTAFGIMKAGAVRGMGACGGTTGAACPLPVWVPEQLCRPLGTRVCYLGPTGRATSTIGTAFPQHKMFWSPRFPGTMDYYSIQRKSNLPAEESGLRPSKDSATRIENCIGETLTTDSSGRVRGNAGLARGTRPNSE
jgi:hypothetical protein